MTTKPKTKYILEDGSGKKLDEFTSWTNAEKFAVNYIINKDRNVWLFLKDEKGIVKEYYWNVPQHCVARNWKREVEK